METKKRHVSKLKRGVFLYTDGSPYFADSKSILPPVEFTEIVSFLVIPQYEDPVLLHQKYVEEGLSVNQIASLFGCARSTLTAKLQEFGIAQNTKNKTNQRKGQVGFGYRVQNGKIVTHKAEWHSITQIVAMRESGISYRQISTMFNQFGVNTKNKKGKWHPTTVMKIWKKHKSDILNR
jgi:transposase